MRTELQLAQTEKELCVARVPIFRGLSHEEQIGVSRLARPRQLAKGEALYLTGDPTSRLLIVHSGTVKITRTEAGGREHLIRVLGPGDFMGESAFLTGRPADHSAIAAEPSRMCVFRHEDLAQLVREHPSIALRMLQDVSHRLAATEHRLAAAISADVSSRLADYLLSLRAVATDEGLEVVLPLPKADIASLIDTTPESLSRQLRHLKESEVVAPRGSRALVIRDVDALMALSSPT